MMIDNLTHQQRTHFHHDHLAKVIAAQNAVFTAVFLINGKIVIGDRIDRVKPSGNPSCWLGPIWGISNYLVFEGLVQYGFTDEAKDLAEKTLALFGRDIAQCGEMHEYYDPESGEPVINQGFQNWNLLSIKMGQWLEEQKEGIV